MKSLSPVARLMSVCCIVVLLLASCKKVNVATELGGDLIPAVDNITTFDTVLEVQAFNYQTPIQQDSSRSTYSNIQYLGSIGSDPLFGKTSGTLFLQLKPSVFKTPFAFSNPANMIALDSVVLVLGYRTLYGDSLAPQQVQVFELDQTNNFVADSNYMFSANNFTYTLPLSSPAAFLPATLNDSLVLFREKSANQLRIRLDDAFGYRLLRYDSTNAYQSDSVFNNNFKGFAVVPGTNGGSNALVGFSLADTNTKLALYYRYTNAGNADTAVTYFRFNSATSASANYIQRDHSGSEFAAVAGDNNPDQLVYIQNAPGTYARLQVPGLAGLSNRVVHRAELIVEQVHDPLALLFTPPVNLYLDAFDSSAGVYRTVPYDVAFAPTTTTNPTNGQINAAVFGTLPLRAVDPSGNSIAQWLFNISRYVQHVVNETASAYGFRLYSPYLTRTYLGTPASTLLYQIQLNPNYAAGRVRVGGGNHPTQPMRIRIVYSKL